MYNADFNLPASVAQPTYISNNNFGQTCNITADALLGAAGSALGAPGSTSNNVFPLLPLAVTPSTCIYKG
jgi:hypothetical protein